MTQRNQGIIFSVAFHILVLISMYFIHFQANTPPAVREFIEYIVIDIATPPITEQIATTRPPATTESQFVENPHLEATQHTTDIDLPIVEHPDLDPVDIGSLPQRADRIAQGTLHGTALQDTLMRATVPTRNVFDSQPGAVTNPLGQGANVGIEGFADEIILQTGNISQFFIEGDVINRTVIGRVLPEFPENLQRNGSVTMTFSVIENGTVQNIRITRRSEPEFERVSIEALRQWSFNRADRVHTGQITFNFILE
ncbi:MAG: energy transducer TonB [Candidatus Cloacimonetes bacterium]|nr:energy transducer TonB [Candidatus Cloacimonadota bacterium]